MAKEKSKPGPVLPTIYSVRKQKVVLDSDLAELYGVPTFRLNEAVKRSQERFPADFSLIIGHDELANLISQSAISSSGAGPGLRSQVATLMREALLANVTILKRLAEIDKRLVEHDSVLREVIDRLQPLLDAPEADEEPKEKIGFHRGNR
ncbi:MAG TPA: ORF6N domain-containing protein [Opitutaceae bacterium]|nr:ORF6N domain-containing protein [Opitutaceae bacterium]